VYVTAFNAAIHSLKARRFLPPRSERACRSALSYAQPLMSPMGAPGLYASTSSRVWSCRDVDGRRLDEAGLVNRDVGVRDRDRTAGDTVR